MNTGNAAVDLSQYVLEVLRNDEEFVLYRGENPTKPASPSVLLLSPSSTQPTSESLRKMEYEYSLRDELDSAFAIRPQAISEQYGRPMLVLEDPGGETLDHFLQGPMELAQFLRVAIGFAKALAGLHKKELIHKDVKPSNAFINRATGHVWLMGFGIASRLRRERQAPDPPEFISGTLPYMAPAQTGRMNRSIDSRSDLYSLGVTLYEMVTGTLPFITSDPLEMIHCHIARKPIPPCERENGVPRPLSAIIMKLLAKRAEERYQTAVGVESDLRRCLAEWEAQGRISEFRLGERDMPDRLFIPEKLYGRESEIHALVGAFDRVAQSGNPELVLVSGYAGIGKSALVNELHKSLVPRRRLFASGKFDQHKRDIPYATLAQALRGLLRPLLAASEDELSGWRHAINVALGPNGRLMTDLVPELKLVIGEQPQVLELPPQDAHRRFQLAIRRFIGVFARPEHPLALFLDDLQWLDAASLDVVDDLLTQADVHHLLIIGAYRDNEVDAAHPLPRRIESLRTLGASISEIRIAPLSHRDVAQLITDALHCEPKRALPLAKSVYDKTAGNPFFATQFLYSLEQERLLAFDHAHSRWFWKLERIHAKGYTDNVADLVVERLRRLPTETQRALQELACLGNVARVTTLCLAYGTTESQVHSDLFEASRAEMVERQQGVYKFTHDRVREAAYSMIPERLRSAAHLRIGRLLLAHTQPADREEAIFEIVNQLNRGASLIFLGEEREELARLNLIAAKRAKASIAYASALNYLLVGRAFLPEDCWEQCYRLVFGIEINRAECEFLTGDTELAEERLAMLASRAASLLDRAEATCLRAVLYTTLGRPDRAVEVCLEYLDQADIGWPPHSTDEQVREEYENMWRQIGNRPIEALFDLPLMSNPNQLATMRVLMELIPPAHHITDANLWGLALLRMANLSISNGSSNESCYAYGLLNLVLGPRFGDYRAGYRLAQLGYELVEKRGLDQFKTRVYSSFGSAVIPWTQHLGMGLPLIRRGLRTGMETGDFTYTVYAYHRLVTNLLAHGDPLKDVQREIESGIQFAQKCGFGIFVDDLTEQLRLIETLRGLPRVPNGPPDNAFDEGNPGLRPEENPRPPMFTCWHWIRQLQTCFYRGDYLQAVAAAVKAQPVLRASSCFFEEAEYHFYGALAKASVCEPVTLEARSEHLEALATHLKQLEIWAGHCPENFENRAALVAAEVARVEGRVLDAEQLYETAINSAHANGFIHNEALANELAARFYLGRGFEKIAKAYLQEARYGYVRWGAAGKVRQLDQLYPQVRQEKAAALSLSVIATPIEQLDLATVVKVSQAVSTEMFFEKLIDKLLRMAIEHAGAERGLLILSQGDELRVVAEAITSGVEVRVRTREGAEIALEMPESLARYVTRVQEAVILDGSLQSLFSADPYIARNCARSILCLPLINQAKLIGLLYLENNLAPDVFTAGRITVLKVLASQAAISLENSRLYRDLADREGKIRRLVDANIFGIFIWDLQGAIITANEAFLSMLQYTREDLVSGGVRWTDLTPPEWRERDERAVAELKETGSAQTYEKEFFRKDGGRVPVLVGDALFEESGNEGVAFVLDLREQKQAEAEIRGLKDHLSRASQLATMGELTASIAHEINQPLAAVVANAEAGLQWLDREKPHFNAARQAFRRIIRDGSDAGEIVRRLRALFRRTAPISVEHRLEDLVTEVLKLLEHETIRRRISVEMALGAELPAVLCDRLQIQQVLLNLITNAMDAVDAAPHAKRSIRVYASWDRVESVLLGIRDYGVGVQDPTRLFETFFTTKEKGLGMGLAISRSIVESHGGQLWLEPTDGPGSTFCFRLPARRQMSLNDACAK